MTPIREALTDRYGHSELMLFIEDEEMDTAIVGVTTYLTVIYDAQKIIDILQERDGMSAEEAEEFAEFNIFSAYMGEGTPTYIWPFNQEE